MPKSTIWKIDPHTEAKHAILRKYLDAWFPILTSHTPKVVFIDGFAGPGEYIGGKEGSPIIAIKSILEHKIEITSEILFLFVEKDKERCDFLQNKLKIIDLPHNIRYKCECGEFAEVVSNIISNLSKGNAKLAPTFVFIDPFGFKGIPFKIIHSIMENPRCEVLINFMFEDINRFMELKQNEVNLDDLFGSTRWREIVGIKEPRKRLELIHRLYKEQLRKIAKYVLSFEIINKFNKTDYFLFFATNSLLGLKKMKESMWRVDPSGDYSFSDATYNPNQTRLFEKEPNYALLKRIIIEKFKGEEVTIEDLEYFILVNTHFRETHYKTKILRKMEKNNEIEVSSTNKRKAGTYPKGCIIKFL